MYTKITFKPLILKESNNYYPHVNRANTIFKMFSLQYRLYNEAYKEHCYIKKHSDQNFVD